MVDDIVVPPENTFSEDVALEAVSKAKADLILAFITNSLGGSEDIEALKEALVAAEHAAAVIIETNKELTDAILSISSNADKDSLLKKPFRDDFVELGEFINPLTAKEQARLSSAKNTSKVYSDELFGLKTQPEESRKFFLPRISFLEAALIDLRLKIIEPLELKVAEARAKYERLKASAVANEKNRKAVIDEFGALVDQFDDFETDGLLGLRKKTLPTFERNARNYISDEPEILFTAEYRVDDQFVGNLLCFKDYRGSSHYEVFKKNLFQFGSQFERILFLHKQDLKEETQNFIPYVRDVLGFKDIDFDRVYIILDTQLKADRIYEYSISAALVPQHQDAVDYDLILEGKGLINRTTLSDFSNATLFGWAGSVLGSVDLAWVLSIINEGVSFFGRAPSEQSLRSLIVNPSKVVGGTEVFVPKNINDVLCITQDAISLFGVRATIEHMVEVLGGLPSEFLGPLKDAVDEERSVFNYDQFRESLKSTAPIFQLVLDIAETQDRAAQNHLSQMSVVLPVDTGSESVTTILGLSNVFKFMNDMFIALTYSQESASFEKLVEIRALIEINREREEGLEEAVKDVRNFTADQYTEEGDPVSTLYNVDLGVSLSSEAVGTTSQNKSKGFFGL